MCVLCVASRFIAFHTGGLCWCILDNYCFALVFKFYELFIVCLTNSLRSTLDLVLYNYTLLDLHLPRLLIDWVARSGWRQIGTHDSTDDSVSCCFWKDFQSRVRNFYRGFKSIETKRYFSVSCAQDNHKLMKLCLIRKLVSYLTK